MMLTPERLRELLDYNDSTGVFTWRMWRGGLAKPAAKAGRPSKSGALAISVDGKRYPAHRLAWMYVYGTFPEKLLDHINGNNQDNRIANLREATPSQNSANSRVRSDSKTGVKGVTVNYNRFEAYVRANGRRRYLGLFKTVDEASAAVEKAHKESFGEFTPCAERAGWTHVRSAA